MSIHDLPPAVNYVLAMMCVDRIQLLREQELCQALSQNTFFTFQYLASPV